MNIAIVMILSLLDIFCITVIEVECRGQEWKHAAKLVNQKNYLGKIWKFRDSRRIENLPELLFSFRNKYDSWIWDASKTFCWQHKTIRDRNLKSHCGICVYHGRFRACYSPRQVVQQQEWLWLRLHPRRQLSWCVCSSHLAQGRHWAVSLPCSGWVCRPRCQSYYWGGFEAPVAVGQCDWCSGRSLMRDSPRMRGSRAHREANGGASATDGGAPMVVISKQLFVV